MQFIYENFTFPPDQSFTVRSEFIELKKYQSFKCHVNYEIALIENCVGKRFIGDHIEEFKGTELVLMASYLPHLWQYYQALDPSIQPHATVVHFFPDFLGKDLYQIPEAKHLQGLMASAAKGIRFSGETISSAKLILQEMLYEKGLTRSALFLRLLDLLANSKNSMVLGSPGFNIVENVSEANKINVVFDYIFKNFKEKISLEEVAAIMPMSPAAFCRFFKFKTGRTLTDFVKEIRIGHAAKLLLEGKLNVSEACYNSGYNNISNFNKHFKEMKGLSPKEFIKSYLMVEQD
ncbi:AraC family transcriptional regulator [Arachidicoccus ginsenosidivorans]|uniref:Helix-turn-helix transcriptional regulator n=1 Tax=Arachidicoccus ginsenosidivorans TaxID=496057 RepID=A0A5B8VSF0_9BACT|nr:AraC family transcriptional regulator [Arachidicoccus ginsenosidivorans]QEC73822.1 helix-turn-helix transcriptional regulator [Arachidicoccus ginsenosidivorans]